MESHPGQQVNYSKFTFNSDESVPLMKFGSEFGNIEHRKSAAKNLHTTSACDITSAALGVSSAYAEVSSGPAEIQRSSLYEGFGQKMAYKEPFHSKIEDNQISKNLSFCCAKFLCISLLLAYITSIVLLQVYLPEQFTYYLFILYIPALAIIISDILGRHILSAIMYPYQNSILKESLDRMSNLRFGQEQARMLHSFIYTLKLKSGILEDRDPNRTASLRSISRLVKADQKNDGLLFQHTESTSSVADDGLDILTFSEMTHFIIILQNYIEANNKAIQLGKKSRLFRRFTQCMEDIKEILQEIQVTPAVEDKHFNAKDFVSVWGYFQYYIDLQQNTEKDNKMTQSSVGLIPFVEQEGVTVKQLSDLEDLAESYTNLIEKSGRSRNTFCRIFCYYSLCCNCNCLQKSRFVDGKSRPNMLFGELDQCRFVLEKDFKSTQHTIKSRNLPNLDCMFFPCIKDGLDPLSRSTIIMCNPNALIYQWMVHSSNAYWLEFFLRRDTNVFIWNYRGYGKSQQSIFSPNYDPNEQKLDAERVLQYLVNNIQVRGQIGVYGRSIGGIAAAHLVRKFPKIIKVFIGDRTLGDFSKTVEHRFPAGGEKVVKLYKILSLRWRVDNVTDFSEVNCFKIHCSDPDDDVIHHYASHYYGIAQKLSRHNYKTNQWQTFYQSLKFLFDTERELFESLNTDQRERATEEMLTHIDITEELMDFQGKLVSSDQTEKFKTYDSIGSMNFIKQTLGQRASQIEASNHWVIFHQIILILNDMEAGCQRLRTTVGYQYKNSFENFVNFLQVLEVYGSGYDQDIHPKYSRMRDKESHRLTAIKSLQKAIRILKISIEQTTNNNEGLHSPVGYQIANSNVLKGQLKKLFEFQKFQFEQLVTIQQQIHNIPDQNEDFVNLAQGHLVKMTCGHRGIPCRTEEKRVSRLLRKSGFVPMLENEPKQPFKQSTRSTEPPPAFLAKKAIQIEIQEIKK